MCVAGILQDVTPDRPCMTEKGAASGIDSILFRIRMGRWQPYFCHDGDRCGALRFGTQ